MTSSLHRRAALALQCAAVLCAARAACGAPTSALGDAGSQGHSEAPFKLLSTTPGSGNGADDGKVTATPWYIVVLTLTGFVVLICCGLGVRRMVAQSAKDAAAMQAALAALGAERDAADDAEAAPGSRSGYSRARRGERVPAPAAGDRQLLQLPRGRGSGASVSQPMSRIIPAWGDAEDAALAASEAADVELVPMYTFIPERAADGEWFVAPLAHLPPRPRGEREDGEAPRRQRRERRREREREAPPPEQPPPPPPQGSNVWGKHFGWG